MQSTQKSKILHGHTDFIPGGGSTFPSNHGDESDGAAVQGGTETYQVLIQSLEIMTGILSPVQHGLVVRGLRV